MAIQGTILDRREKSKKVAGLNLVSLMDIFTILVFFLLMNSGDSQEIEKASFISLPDSQASSSFQNDLLIFVGEDSISINDEEIVSLDLVKKVKGKTVDELAKVLKIYAKDQGELTEFEKTNGRSVTIMGDQEVPYLILKSVMATCSQENFRDIALAVNQVMNGVVEVSY
ncbi:MAG: biopolymer transporter ExbD [Bermanella sp.]